MKKFFVIMLLSCTISNQVFAHSVKVYNKQGTQVGTARMSEGKEYYEILDMNGKPLETDEQLYSPVGMPLKNLKKDFYRSKVEYRNSSVVSF